MYDLYFPIVISALTVLILGAWNPRGLQTVQNGQPNGNPNYMWLALISLLVGLLAAYLTHSSNYRGRKSTEYY